MRRDLSRIQKLTRMINTIWCKYPDLRFNQLLESLQIEFNNSNGCIYTKELWEKEEHRGIVTYRRTTKTDLFYVEDDEFMEFLQKKLDEYNK
jgi:hypothetical protein